MKNTVIKFGIISGLIITVLMFATLPFVNKIGFDNGVYIGYTTMLLSFLMVFFGIRSYREKVNGGTITFLKAFKVGGLIALITCAFYVVSWLIIYYQIMPDFPDKYAAYAIEHAKQLNKSQAEIDQITKEMQQYKEMVKNPLIHAAITFTEPAPVALVVALLSALILKKKKAESVKV